MYECEYRPESALSPRSSTSPTYVGGGSKGDSTLDFVQILGSGNVKKTESESFGDNQITSTETGYEDT